MDMVCPRETKIHDHGHIIEYFGFKNLVGLVLKRGFASLTSASHKFAH